MLSTATSSSSKITLPKGAKKVIKTKYLILELEQCPTCTRIMKKRSGRHDTLLVKAEMGKIQQFKIDTDLIQMDCPSCSKNTRLNRIKWWGTGFDEDNSIYLDSKGKKEIKVSEIKDITDDLLKHRANSIKDDVKFAEAKLKNLHELENSLKSILSKDKEY